MAWDSELAEQSAKEAKKELEEELAKMSPEKRMGALAVADWQRKWFNGHGDVHATGHKALGRILVELSKQQGS